MRKSLYLSATRRACCLCFLLTLLLFSGCKKEQSGGVQAQAQPVNPHSATITWTASKSQVAGYNVYRASASGQPVKLTDGIVLGTQYTDRTVQAGQAYSYYVTSVDLKGIESKPSEKITVTIPATVAAPAKQ